MRTLATLALAIALVACSARYEKPGITQATADRDSRYCQAVARGGGGSYGIGLAHIVGNLEAEGARYEACMLGKGYSPAN